MTVCCVSFDDLERKFVRENLERPGNLISRICWEPWICNENILKALQYPVDYDSIFKGNILNALNNHKKL